MRSVRLCIGLGVVIALSGMPPIPRVSWRQTDAWAQTSVPMGSRSQEPEPAKQVDGRSREDKGRRTEPKSDTATPDRDKHESAAKPVPARLFPPNLPPSRPRTGGAKTSCSRSSRRWRLSWQADFILPIRREVSRLRRVMTVQSSLAWGIAGRFLPDTNHLW